MSKREKLADIVIEKLQEHISLGKWKKGMKIPAEPELMEQFKVGRSTIREAIKTLAQNGILRVQQGSGTYVNDISTDTESLEQRLRRAAQRELNQVRTLLEREIIRLAVVHRKHAQLKEMQQALEKRKEAVSTGDYPAAIDADILFHTKLAVASHNSVLADLFISFSNVLRNSFQQRDAGSVAQFGRTHALHEQLLQAVADKDEQAALECLDSLLQHNLRLTK
ncbi:DNA-binding FadR family transcriptional regulator [Chitinophaga dinghuensis]|uniref:DNA-binding FadR family transcriptional regulator n=1 Tax=Chitinophaga dinghuensis TaxID=1539050 RepID=A0A327VSX9_9BACT|nr:FadR/GntR family transcriptional regulator [Chitinophaga dinghuensis]RAJ79009.1 DNA-binding FadR family transcriptional regulator [Chitinophaga dinghuensis]